MTEPETPAAEASRPGGIRVLGWLFGLARIRNAGDIPVPTRLRGAGWFVTATATILVGAILLAFLGPYLLADPNAQNLIAAFTPPTLHGHLFGTDELGRDYLARVIAGAKTTLSIALITDLIVLAIGVSIGTVAALLGGTAEEIVMRFVDLVYSLPGLLMTLVIVFVLGPNTTSVVIALCADGWLVFARLSHGMTKSLRRSGFIEFARVSGCGRWRVVRRHVIPHLASPVLTVATLELARLALAEATLSFLGLGVQPPAVSLGMLLENGENNMSVAWWLITLPGLYLVILILSANVLASWVRVVSDPIQQGVFER